MPFHRGMCTSAIGLQLVFVWVLVALVVVVPCSSLPFTIKADFNNDFHIQRAYVASGIPQNIWIENNIALYNSFDLAVLPNQQYHLRIELNTYNISTWTTVPPTAPLKIPLYLTLSPSQYSDVSSIGIVTSVSGGCIREAGSYPAYTSTGSCVISFTTNAPAGSIFYYASTYFSGPIRVVNSTAGSVASVYSHGYDQLAPDANNSFHAIGVLFDFECDPQDFAAWTFASSIGNLYSPDLLVLPHTRYRLYIEFDTANPTWLHTNFPAYSWYHAVPMDFSLDHFQYKNVSSIGVIYNWSSACSSRHLSSGTCYIDFTVNATAGTIFYYAYLSNIYGRVIVTNSAAGAIPGPAVSAPIQLAPDANNSFHLNGVIYDYTTLPKHFLAWTFASSIGNLSSPDLLVLPHTPYQLYIELPTGYPASSLETQSRISMYFSVDPRQYGDATSIGIIIVWSSDCYEYAVISRQYSTGCVVTFTANTTSGTIFYYTSLTGVSGRIIVTDSTAQGVAGPGGPTPTPAGTAAPSGCPSPDGSIAQLEAQIQQLNQTITAQAALIQQLQTQTAMIASSFPVFHYLSVYIYVAVRNPVGPPSSPFSVTVSPTSTSANVMYNMQIAGTATVNAHVEGCDIVHAHWHQVSPPNGPSGQFDTFLFNVVNTTTVSWSIYHYGNGYSFAGNVLISCVTRG